MSVYGLDSDVVDMINEFGNTITVPNGTQSPATITALVNENYAKLREAVSDEDLESAKGRVVLFRMTKEDAAKIPEGVLLPYNGKFYTLRTLQSATFSNVTLVVSILGASGGYG